MSYVDIQTACVVRYPYLWAREASQDEGCGPVPLGLNFDVSAASLE